MRTQTQPRSSLNSLVEVGLLVLICGLFAWFIILPKKAEVDKKRTEQTNAEQQRDDMANKLSKLQSLIKTLQSDTKEIGLLNQALPLEGNSVRLRLLIQSFADSVGVTVGDINVGGPSGAVASGDKNLLANPYSTTRSLKTINGTMYVLGTYGQLEAFLKKLETSGRLIDVSDLIISQGAQGNLNMALTIKAYYLAP